jgi:putative membrane protein
MKHMHLFTVVITGALIASAPQLVRAQTATENSTSTKNVSSRESHFIEKAAKGNTGEVALAEAVKGRTQDPQLREYTDMLIRDHTQANRELRPIADARGVAWPTTMDEGTKHELNRAQTLAPAELDTAMIKHWVKDHKKDIKEYEQADKHVQDPQLKQYITATLPVLHKHLDRAEALETSHHIGHEAAGAQKSGTTSSGNSLDQNAR